jgi:hypothetical protein
LVSAELSKPDSYISDDLVAIDPFELERRLGDCLRTAESHVTHQARRTTEGDLSAGLVLAATAKLGLLAGFLAVLAAVLPVRTALGDHALAGWVRALVRVGHDVTSRPLYASTETDTRRDYGRGAKVLGGRK